MYAGLCSDRTRRSEVEVKNRGTKDTNGHFPQCHELHGRSFSILLPPIHVHIHEAAHFLGKVTALGGLCCLALLFV